MTPRVEILREAAVLEALGGEWTVQHAAAFCSVSTTFIYRSDCPRVEKAGVRDVKGKPILRFDPQAVREWNAARTKKVA